ncbi:TPA: RIP metalloprotease RseP [Candidatus Bipolaricaulota bacterium]|nr:RIP metalloprotease RseP [Candidatus Bipolaricaulota bacterium]
MTWLLLLAVILVLVAAHEGGHFLAAKLLGVAVEEFAIGFGPVLFSRKRGETRYSLRAFPIGGFVRLAGEEGGTSEVPFERTYYGRPAWVRFMVSLAGPVANIVLAGLIVVGAISGFGLPHLQVAGVIPGEPAAGALEVGDVVLEVGGREVWLRDEVGPAIQAAAPGPVRFLLLRRGAELELSITPRWDPDGERYLVGAYFSSRVYLTRLEDLEPGSPLSAAGLRAGDEIVGACGQSVSSLAELYGELEAGCRELTVRRGEGILQAALPELRPDELLAGAEFDYLPEVVARPSLPTAVELGIKQISQFFLALGQVIRGLLTGAIPAGQAVAGPVGMAGLFSQGLQVGGLATLLLIAFISLNLAAFNLLPFPALDGARMAFALFEMTTRRKVSPKVEAAIHALGFMLLLALMLLITWRDILRLFG